MSQQNKVTIIMATYNRAHLIEETLASIQNQTYKNWECLIVDDNSEDQTKIIIDKYSKKDNRFSYFLKSSKYKKGLSGSRNFGLDLAKERKAEFIQFFDDDDIMHPRKIELQIQPLLDDNSIAFTTCKYRHYYGDEILKFELEDYDCNISTDNLFKDFYFGKVRINSLGPLWGSNLILKYRFDEDLLFGEERDLYLKIFLNEEPNFKNIDYVLFYYRKHDLSNTKRRYSRTHILLSRIKSDYNLYYFIRDNSLWNYFLIKEMIKKFILINYDHDISKDLKSLIKSKDLDLRFKKYLLKFLIDTFNIFRKLNKVILNKI